MFIYASILVDYHASAPFIWGMIRGALVGRHLHTKPAPMGGHLRRALVCRHLHTKPAPMGGHPWAGT